MVSNLNNISSALQKQKYTTNETEREVGGRSQTTFPRGGGRWSKKLTFCKLLYHRKCKARRVGGQKKTNLVNVVFERPLGVLQEKK